MKKHGRSSRREFLRQVGAATGVAASAVISGCEATAGVLRPGDAGVSKSGQDAGASGPRGESSCPPAESSCPPAESSCPPAESSCPPATECRTPGALPTEWAREADVVVLGTGFAGLAAAIAASDAKAKVLVLEKMSQEEEGGNSKVSGNIWWTPTSAAEGVKYIEALCIGSTDAACIQMLAQELSILNDWLSKTLRISASQMGVFQPEYPELPSASSVRVWANSRDGGLWQPLRDGVSSRHVEIAYGTPAVDLIQDPSTREVKGVVADSNGKRINIKCKRGVVLACGGFEFDFAMQAQFLPGWPVYGQGTPGNTGDGIKMAQKAGAALWHMNNALAHIGCFVRDPKDSKPIPVPLSLPKGCILVDKFGSRFMNESRGERHGFGHKEFLFFFDGLKQSFSRIPCYGVFVEPMRQSRSLQGGLEGWNGLHHGYDWSSDNSAEVSAGWIKKGQTIEALASAFGADPSTLAATVSRYNGFCSAGKDQDFGRSSSSMKALSTAPYYAIPIYPMMYNTQGGPRRNEKCQVIDPFGQPIPRLYSAGELGSFWSWMYNGGGNASEAVVTGRISGTNTAQESPWA
jgi:succinate dehydrogenase/fumarate reductase flavoprotein subunit